MRLTTKKPKERYIYWGLELQDLGLEDPRFTVLNKSQLHTLVIYNVAVNDSATYRCVEDSGYGSKHFHVLTVEGDFSFQSTSLICTLL